MPSVFLCALLRSRIEAMSVGGGLETLVVSAPELWPGRSFLDLVRSLHFLPLRAALLLPLARRKLIGARLLRRLCVLRNARLLLRGGARDKLRQWRCHQSHRQRESEYDFMHECTSLYFHGCGALQPAIDLSPQPEKDDNPHRLYCSIVRSHERPARPPVAN